MFAAPVKTSSRRRCEEEPLGDETPAEPWSAETGIASASGPDGVENGTMEPFLFLHEAVLAVTGPIAGHALGKGSVEVEPALASPDKA